MNALNSNKSIKGTFWTMAFFYMLIAFEFFYMASPFAIYFYSVYKPGLNFLNEYPLVNWLTLFFLPHIVEETSSTLINLHNIIGAVLTLLGFMAFCVGAAQVYYYKLTKKGPVKGGIYNIIRHPQYVSLAICSFGLLLLWPRHLALIMFVTMLFGYYLLARAEERECEQKFGRSYIEYQNRTNMFLPFNIPLINRLPRLPQSRFKKFIFLTAIYILTLGVSIFLARSLQSFTLDSLYAYYSKDSAYISQYKMDSETMDQLIVWALSNKEVQTRLNKSKTEPNAKYLNYILPDNSYVSEIPMNESEEVYGNHFLRSRPSNQNLYKIIFTQVELKGNQNAEGKEILLNVVKRTPIMEVWVDVFQAKVMEIKDPPEVIQYENVPVPVF